uniref:Uncharacterized protein n=1 Tax=Oryza nivara TaxID=4536 RepID=A0A0E0FMY5_ORYNI
MDSAHGLASKTNRTIPTPLQTLHSPHAPVRGAPPRTAAAPSPPFAATAERRHRRSPPQSPDSLKKIMWVGSIGDAEEWWVSVGFNAAAARKVASLFSQRGKKGPNQDSVILCQCFSKQ